MHPHEIEEREMQFGPRMWDATPGVCCAYFQTGACSHTEGFDQDEVDELVAEDRRNAIGVDVHPPRHMVTQTGMLRLDEVPF